MTAEEMREYCIQKSGVEESFPFDNETLVFKVGGKMFLLLSLDADPLSFNVKCEPGKALELREKYSSVLPGYHMNKQHWNTVLCDGAVPKKVLLAWIEDSYHLVYASLSKKIQATIPYIKKG